MLQKMRQHTPNLNSYNDNYDPGHYCQIHYLHYHRTMIIIIVIIITSSIHSSIVIAAKTRDRCTDEPAAIVTCDVRHVTNHVC